jgi:glycosyltransferase involved in cell wall biosynthesis
MTPWLLVAGDLTPLGGMDAANHALARHLGARGDELHVVAHRVWPDLETLPSLTVHAVWRPFGRHLLGSPLLARAGFRVWQTLRNRGGRAVANGGNCALADANWVHYLHAAFTPQVAGSSARRARHVFSHRRDVIAERRALRGARIVICNSERTRREVVQRHDIADSRTRVVYYGSDSVRFSPATPGTRLAVRQAMGWTADRPLVGFVGALGDRRKGFDSLFEAWLTLCRSGSWDANLVVIGRGAELTAWRSRAAASGHGDRFHFLGFRSDVPDVLAALDGFVHPARYEAYGLSVHEAICCGVPAIVTATAGIAERFPDSLDDLLLVNPDDSGEIANRLRFWRANVERLRRQILPLSETLRAWTWDAMAARIVTMIEQAA